MLWQCRVAVQTGPGCIIVDLFPRYCTWHNTCFPDMRTLVSPPCVFYVWKIVVVFGISPVQSTWHTGTVGRTFPATSMHPYPRPRILVSQSVPLSFHWKFQESSRLWTELNFGCESGRCMGWWSLTEDEMNNNRGRQYPFCFVSALFTSHTSAVCCAYAPCTAGGRCCRELL